MAQHAVYTKFVTHTSQGNELVNILTKASNIVGKAKGCRYYIINQEEDNTDNVWVTELWETAEDHAISQTLDGCKEIIEAAGHLLVHQPEQVRLVPVAGKA